MVINVLNPYIQKGKRFELIQQDPDGASERFISHFIDKNDEFYTISTPLQGDKVCKLSEGEDVKLYVYTQEGVFSLLCKVLERAGDNWHISLPKNVKHSQRREFLRVDMNVRAYLKVYKPDGKTISISALTSNLCGRGMSLISDSPIGDYSKIEVRLLLDDMPIETLAELVYSKPINTSEGLKYLAAFMFISIKDKEIDAIVKECLLFQLREKQKMLKMSE